MRSQVSVVIAAYNAAAFLPLTLDSVLRQTHSCVECVIVNDGSTDATLEQIQRWEKVANSKRGMSVKIVNQENRGLILTRKSGFEASSGEFVQFLDADDLIHPTKLASCVEQFKSETDVVVGRTKFFYSDVEGKALLSTDVETLGWPDDISRVSTISTYPWHSVGPVFRRRIVAAEAKFPSDLNPYVEEREFHGRIKLSGAVVHFADACHSFYRKGNSGSLTGNPDKIAQGRIDSVRVSRELLEEYESDSDIEWESLSRKAVQMYFRCCSPRFKTHFRKLARREAKEVLLRRYPSAHWLLKLAANPITDKTLAFVNRCRGT
jgi:glycosyltransferase involved in cell wall biosynthesis